jgi:hypothetical protein
MLAGLATLWLFGVACGVMAVVSSRQNGTRWQKMPLAMALAALTIGGVGFWPPSPSWPRLYYTYTSGEAQKTLDSTWFFIVPLLAGAVSLPWVMRCRRPSNHEAP